MQQFEGKVQLVLYPIAFRPKGEGVAQAAWCAGEQGKFWEFHDMLFRRWGLWNNLDAPLQRLLDFARDLNLDVTALKSCVESGRMQSRVEADRAYAQQLRVNSTPTLFMNDNPNPVVGVQGEGDLVRLIRQELDRVQRPGQ
jgi:protein-disulfide isomerase